MKKKRGTEESANKPLNGGVIDGERLIDPHLLRISVHATEHRENDGLCQEFFHTAKTQGKVLALLGCRICLPPELEREITVIEFALPGKEELGRVLDGIIESAALKSVSDQQREAAIDAATGSTTVEAENSFALSVVECGTIDPDIIAREKALCIRKNGLLEIVEARESLDSIGGLDQLKDWLLKRKNAFTRKAVDYGLPSPRGLLIIGIPGSGKSLTAKATARVEGEWGQPLS